MRNLRGLCRTGERAVQAPLAPADARGTLAGHAPIGSNPRTVCDPIAFGANAFRARRRSSSAPPPTPRRQRRRRSSRRQLRRLARRAQGRSRRLDAYKAIGFQVIAFVPTYAYVGLNKIDLASGPDAAELGGAVEAALGDGFQIVIKPHLDPPAYQSGFDQFQSENASWRVACPWRGFFDLDPMTDAYRDGVVFGALRMLKEVLDKPALRSARPVRLELGVELMNSMVYGPERWEQLLAAAKKERHRLGLDGKVILSHNFTHHLEIADDYVGRMTAAGRAALRRYIRGLDALSLSQYMDLTAAVPARRARPAPADGRRDLRRARCWPRRTSATTSSRARSGFGPRRSRRCTSESSASAAAASSTRTSGRATRRRPRRTSWRTRSRSATPAFWPTWRARTGARPAAPSSGSPAVITTSSAGRSRATPTPRRSPRSRRRSTNEKSPAASPRAGLSSNDVCPTGRRRCRCRTCRGRIGKVPPSIARPSRCGRRSPGSSWDRTGCCRTPSRC